MWTSFAYTILKYRLIFILAIGLITVGMLYKGRNVEMAYDYAAAVPSNDSSLIYFQQFQKTFGQDGNVLALGLKDSSLYQLSKFQALRVFAESLTKIPGVTQVVSLPTMPYLVKDTTVKKFNLQTLFPENITSQATLDSLLNIAQQLKFYEGQLMQPNSAATVVLITIDKNILNSNKRDVLVGKITNLGDQFTKQTDIQLRYAGLPFIRSVMSVKVAQELRVFLLISILVTAIVLFIFFRSWKAVVFPLLIIGIIISWTIGTLGLLNYKITLLTGLLPPILVVIGIPNCVYLITKYHQEYRLTNDKIKALGRVVSKIGAVTLITNLTTAIGFAVLIFNDIRILREFGIIASINVINTFFICLILIPALFSYLPAPKAKHTRHLDSKPLVWFIELVVTLVSRQRKWVYGVVVALVVVSMYGIAKIKTVAFMVEDIPAHSQLRKDLAFFEANFQGIMPLEIVIDTGKKKGATKLNYLKAIEEFQTYLDSIPTLSPPISLISFLKASRQAFYGNDPSFYALPSNQDKNFIFKYLQNNTQTQNKKQTILHSFVDSTGQQLRISLKVADIGSIRMDSLVNHQIIPTAAIIFKDLPNFKVHVTGTTPLFIKGNDFLIANLKSSLALAFVLIGVCMAALFRSSRMIAISLLSNTIPLIVTAGIMGYFGIPLKPSTALIFSIAFGIAVDDSIHYLAKYKSELLIHNFSVTQAVIASLRETGTGMIYTSLVLFFGFITFVGSEFGGTIALGLLTSLTLLFAMFINLILLPALLINFDKSNRKKAKNYLIEHYHEFYYEDNDEEIDLNMLKLKTDEIHQA